MPPRKDISASQAQQDASSEGIDAFELPKSIVTRIAKSAVSHFPRLPHANAHASQLPSDAKLQKETIGALVKGSTVFINYLGACFPCMARRFAHPPAQLQREPPPRHSAPL